MNLVASTLIKGAFSKKKNTPNAIQIPSDVLSQRLAVNQIKTQKQLLSQLYNNSSYVSTLNPNLASVKDFYNVHQPLV